VACLKLNVHFNRFAGKSYSGRNKFSICDRALRIKLVIFCRYDSQLNIPVFDCYYQVIFCYKRESLRHKHKKARFNPFEASNLSAGSRAFHLEYFFYFLTDTNTLSPFCHVKIVLDQQPILRKRKT